MNIKEELQAQLRKIQRELDYNSDSETRATLLLAKTQTLIALQSYQDIDGYVHL